MSGRFGENERERGKMGRRGKGKKRMRRPIIKIQFFFFYLFINFYNFRRVNTNFRVEIHTEIIHSKNFVVSGRMKFLSSFWLFLFFFCFFSFRPLPLVHGKLVRVFKSRWENVNLIRIRDENFHFWWPDLKIKTSWNHDFPVCG